MYLLISNPVRDTVDDMWLLNYCPCQAYSKCGLLSTKEDKFSGNTVITGVNRGHQLLEEFRPYKMSSSSSSPGGAPAELAQPAAAGAAAAAGAGGAVAPLVVEEVYKPSKDVKGNCGSEGQGDAGCLCWRLHRAEQ